MDTTGQIYLAIGIVVLIGMTVLFWFLSQRCPKGVLLAVGIGLWLLGGVIASTPTRETLMIGGLCKLSGFIGGILGLVDAVRKKKTAGVPPVIRTSSGPPPVPQQKK